MTNPFASAEAWSVSTLLPVGNHVVKITESEDASAKKDGKPQVRLRLANSDGDIQDWVPYNAEFLAKIVSVFDAAGIARPQEGEFDPSTYRLSGSCIARLLNKEVGIVIREEDKFGGQPGEKIRRVQGYLKPDGVASVPAPPPSTGTVAPSTGGGSSFGADDIPF